MKQEKPPDESGGSFPFWLFVIFLVLCLGLKHAGYVPSRPVTAEERAHENY